jgi:hypothetical protein
MATCSVASGLVVWNQLSNLKGKMPVLSLHHGVRANSADLAELPGRPLRIIMRRDEAE